MERDYEQMTISSKGGKDDGPKRTSDHKIFCRDTVSTMDSLPSPRFTQTQSPDFSPKPKPFETNASSPSNKLHNFDKDFSPWSPGFASKADSWDGQRKSEEGNNEAYSSGFELTVEQSPNTDIFQLTSNSEAESPTSPISTCSVGYSEPPSPLEQDPFFMEEDRWMLPQGELLTSGSETSEAYDPWDDSHQRLNRAGSSSSSWYRTSAVLAVVVVVFSLFLIHWSGAHDYITRSGVYLTHAYVLVVAAMGIVGACKWYSTRGGGSEPLTAKIPMSPCSPASPLSPRRFVATFSFFESLLRFSDAQTIWNQMTTRFMDHADIVSFGRGLADHFPWNTDVFSDVFTSLPDVSQLDVKAGSKHMQDVMRWTAIAGFDFEKATTQLDLMTGPGHYESKIVFPKGCHVTHISLGGRFEIVSEIADSVEVKSWLHVRSVKTRAEVIVSKSNFKKIAHGNLEPRSFLLTKLEYGHQDNLDSRAHLHLGMHFAILSQLAYAYLPPDYPNAPRKGNLVDEYFGDLGGCAEFLKYHRDVEVYYVDDQSLQAVKFENEHEIVIAVRGTVPEPLAKGTLLGPNIVSEMDTSMTFDLRYGIVHNGFLVAATALWQETGLASFFSDHRKHNHNDNRTTLKRVYFVGHSYGAGLVQLLARFCRDDPDVNYPSKLIEMHTFGGPQIFIWARQFKFLKIFSEGSGEDDWVGLQRVKNGLIDWDPIGRCEPGKIHHERWAKDYDIVPRLADFVIFKHVMGGGYMTRFLVVPHLCRANRLPGFGHAAMVYHDAIKQISRQSFDIERISDAIKKSVSHSASKKGKEGLHSKI